MKCRVCGAHNCSKKISKAEVIKFLDYAKEEEWCVDECIEFLDDYFEEEMDECSVCNEKCPFKKE